MGLMSGNAIVLKVASNVTHVGIEIENVKFESIYE